MNKHFISSSNLGSFLTAFLYGFSFVLPAYMHALGGNDFDVGVFLLISGLSTIVTVLFIRILFRVMTALSVSVVSVLLLGVGIVSLGIIHQFGSIIFVIALIMGFGWGGFYISGPIALSNNLNEKNRAVYFSYLAAWNAMGAGLSPIIFNYLSSVHLSTHTIFKASSIPCILAMCCFIYAKRYDNSVFTINEKTNDYQQLFLIKNFLDQKQFILL